MKLSHLPLLALACGITACESMKSPVSSSSFDPLRPPGTSTQLASASYGPELSPGQFVAASIPNTAFFKDRPKGTEDASKLLAVGTQMKIISVESNYVKVELDSGEVGYVPAVMVSSTNPSTPELLPIDGAYQVYPPLIGGESVEPLPIIDPGGLPPSGSIPAIIDPNAPITENPVTIDAIPEMKVEEPAKELDPVAEAVRKKVEAAKAEEEKQKEIKGAE